MSIAKADFESIQRTLESQDDELRRVAAVLRSLGDAQLAVPTRALEEITEAATVPVAPKHEQWGGLRC